MNLILIAHGKWRVDLEINTNRWLSSLERTSRKAYRNHGVANILLLHSGLDCLRLEQRILDETNF